MRLATRGPWNWSATNVIELPFATVRLRQRVTKGAGSRTKGLLMAYKLLDMAQARWRRSLELVPADHPESPRA